MTNKLFSLFPILGAVSRYNKDLFRSDLTAGITVAVMLVPQGMAYSVLAGLPPIYGLYASIVPILLYAIFGTSGQLAVGPVAMVSLLIFTGVGALADVGSDQFTQLAILAAFGVGVVQLAMGLFRMGFLVNFLSHPVLSGFTSAAAMIIGTSQLKSLFGVSLPSSKLVHEVWLAFFGSLTHVNLATMVIGLGSVALLIGLRRW
ncbi:MAG: sodium-independent anion transporter, partial [Flavobacteriia bacterium]|nr:sodium-independent anion transporter [Flavobacteriia bacterium]